MIEYEYFFTEFDKMNVIDHIKKQNNGKYKGTYLFRVQVFECKNCYLRVRDEGYKVTLTHKKKSDNGFDMENEIIIDSFDKGCNLLDVFGFQKKYYYEKIREIWKCDNCEIIFDTIPGLYDTMEIECISKTKLDKLKKQLDLEPTPAYLRSNLHQHLFGIDLNKKIGDNTFKNIKKVLLPLVTKNKKEFLCLMKDQTQKFKNICLPDKKSATSHRPKST